MKTQDLIFSNFLYLIAKRLLKELGKHGGLLLRSVTFFWDLSMQLLYHSEKIGQNASTHLKQWLIVVFMQL